MSDPTAGGSATPRDHVIDHDPMPRRDETVAVAVAARSQLEAIRDEWLRPLIDQIAGQARTIGRLEEQWVAAEQRAIDRGIALEAEQQRRQCDARQADQLVTLLEQRVRDLEAEHRRSSALAEQAPPETPPLPAVPRLPVIARGALQRLRDRLANTG